VDDAAVVAVAMVGTILTLVDFKKFSCLRKASFFLSNADFSSLMSTLKINKKNLDEHFSIENNALKIMIDENRD